MKWWWEEVWDDACAAIKGAGRACTNVPVSTWISMSGDDGWRAVAAGEPAWGAAWVLGKLLSQAFGIVIITWLWQRNWFRPIYMLICIYRNASATQPASAFLTYVSALWHCLSLFGPIYRGFIWLDLLAGISRSQLTSYREEGTDIPFLVLKHSYSEEAVAACIRMCTPTC